MGRLTRSRFRGANDVEHKSCYWLASGAAFFAYAMCLYAFLHVTGLTEPSSKRPSSSIELGNDDYPGIHQSANRASENGVFVKDLTNAELNAKIPGRLKRWIIPSNDPNSDDHQLKSGRSGDDLLKEERSAERNGPSLDDLLSGSPISMRTGTRERRSAKNGEQSESSAANSDAGNASEPVKEPLFPEDLFTKEERQRGAVILHMLGVIYMFVALAIVCDEFFVPSLDVIIEKLGIPDDVAGATFMAAGGSAPELFTSVIGVFVSFDDVGIGTIVGSAVFNILFVIGMCALFSKTILTLTWWPLFRDCTFYSISLIALVAFFLDNHIVWWEAGLLLSIYAGYVGFMRWNEKVERFVKGFLYRNTIPRISSSDHLVGTNNVSNRGPASQVSVSSGGSSIATGALVGPNTVDRNRVASAGIRGSKFRHGLLTLMIHSIDPMHDGGHVDDKANKLHAIASLRVLLDATKEQTMNNGRDAPEEAKVNDPQATSSAPIPTPLSPVNAAVTTVSLAEANIIAVETCTSAAVMQQDAGAPNADAAASDDDENRPLDLSWPQGTRKRLTYVFLAPLLWPLWLTLPDTRTPQGKRFFVVTFIGSILWIAGYSYLMVWWANLSGETFNIPPEVMGLTFLAAGTSIPDLITSVIVARKGLGDMAVSSSVGSNIFDICVGLPLPWLLYCIIKGIPVEVNSAGMACSVLVLFGMLCFVVLSIACFRWKMNKALGFTMFIFYFVFVAVSLGFEYGTIVCPV